MLINILYIEIYFKNQRILVHQIIKNLKIKIKNKQWIIKRGGRSAANRWLSYYSKLIKHKLNYTQVIKGSFLFYYTKLMNKYSH